MPIYEVEVVCQADLTETWLIALPADTADKLEALEEALAEGRGVRVREESGNEQDRQIIRFARSADDAIGMVEWEQHIEEEALHLGRMILQAAGPAITNDKADARRFLKALEDSTLNETIAEIAQAFTQAWA